MLQNVKVINKIRIITTIKNETEIKIERGTICGWFVRFYVSYEKHKTCQLKRHINKLINNEG